MQKCIGYFFKMDLTGFRAKLGVHQISVIHTEYALTLKNTKCIAVESF